MLMVPEEEVLKTTQVKKRLELRSTASKEGQTKQDQTGASMSV